MPESPAPILDPPAEPTGPADAFDAPGTFTVGTGAGDIAPGTYKTGGPGTGISQTYRSSCYYARLSGTGGELSDITANNNVRGSGTLTIKEGDEAVEFSGPCTWVKQDS